MAKRKNITNLDDLLGGKPGATGTTKTPPKPAPKKTPAPAKAKPIVKTQTRPAPALKKAKRTSATLEKEYKLYGKPWAVRLPPALIEELKQTAQREDTNYNALTHLALQLFIDNYKAGRIKLGFVKKDKRWELVNTK